MKKRFAQDSFIHVVNTDFQELPSDGLVQLAVGIWYENFVPDIQPLETPVSIARAGFILERLLAFQCVSSHVRYRIRPIINTLAKRLSSDFVILPISTVINNRENRGDPLAHRWGLCTSIARHIQAILPYQTRHYIHRMAYTVNEDAERVKVVKQRGEQPKTEANFNVSANCTDEASWFPQLIPRCKLAALSILDHISASQNIDEESSLISAIEETLKVHIMSSDEDFLNSAWRFEDKLEAGVYAPGVNEKGQWLLVSTDSHKAALIAALEPLSVKIVERLIQQGKLISEQSPQWITSKLRLMMYHWNK